MLALGWIEIIYCSYIEDINDKFLSWHIRNKYQRNDSRSNTKKGEIVVFLCKNI